MKAPSAGPKIMVAVGMSLFGVAAVTSDRMELLYVGIGFSCFVAAICMTIEHYNSP